MPESNSKGRIHILDKNMINMIAAGEVIERPASVVKELLENSIDAGADKVHLYIEDGGLKLIQITDNGGGISPEDIPTAFEPHATSKIRCVEDLSHISSMGFRGEALASIASIAQVRLVTRQSDSIQANSIEIDCGDKGQVCPASSDYGTTITVRNIFYKLPARRKFLRTSNTEMGHITEQFTRIALANPNLEMKLTHNSKLVYFLQRNQSIEERIGELVGKDIQKNLIHIGNNERGVGVDAWICSPSVSRGTNKYQYTFLNGRYIRDKFISHAIKEAYRGMLEPSKHPITFIFLKMPYESYDVNVHPTKTEVRFDNSNLIHSQVLASLREKLLNVKVSIAGDTGKGQITPLSGSVDKAFSEQMTIDSPVSFDDAMKNDEYGDRVKESMENFFEQSPRKLPSSLPNFWEKGHSTGTKSYSTGRAGLTPTHKFEPITFDKPHDFPLVDESLKKPSQRWMQVHNSYILVENDEGFEIIDQHALHERIIYERMYAKVENAKGGRLESQRLLIPETFDVRPEQEELLEMCKDLFDKLGIEVEQFGPGIWAIQSFPTLLKKANASEFMNTVIGKLSETAIEPGSEELVHFILDTAACKAAIKAGQKLSDQEIEHLLEEAEKTPRSERCPHGRPSRITFSIKSLDKQFKRTGF